MNINNISHLQAYDNYQLISSSLPEAIEACIDAAGHEFDVSRQRTLLRAATYGLAFCRFSFLPFRMLYLTTSLVILIFLFVSHHV